MRVAIGRPSFPSPIQPTVGLAVIAAPPMGVR
jgi:hypothetical protein